MKPYSEQFWFGEITQISFLVWKSHSAIWLWHLNGRIKRRSGERVFQFFTCLFFICLKKLYPSLSPPGNHQSCLQPLSNDRLPINNIYKIIYKHEKHQFWCYFIVLVNKPWCVAGNVMTQPGHTIVARRPCTTTFSYTSWTARRNKCFEKIGKYCTYTQNKSLFSQWWCWWWWCLYSVSG